MDVSSINLLESKVVDVLQPEVSSTNTASSTNMDMHQCWCISVGATTITNRVCEFTDEAGLDMRKMGGIRTDGAATMDGCHNGCMSQKN